ncbi:MAG: glycosyltransferase family 4 protein [Fimbriimonadaceae bacterium]|nr:MAG: glycosyltransferase family 4 protein [Fimbriimonadaceae bacterium]
MRFTVAIDARLATRTMTGDTSYWRGLIGGLRRIGFVSQALLVSNAPKPVGIPALEDFAWLHVPGGSERWWSLVRFPLAARKAAKALHTQYFLSPMAGRAGMTTIHDVSFFVDPAWFSARDGALLRKGLPGSVRRAAKVFTVSETSRGEIERYLPGAAGKTAVTPNALRDDWPRLTRLEAEEILRPLGLPEQYLLSVGTRWPRKNMALAAEAAKVAQIPLVLTGKAWGSPEPDGAIFTGYVDDLTLAALYRRATLYLAPSCHEGFGIPLLEAFASECPVLCSRGGALPEVAGGAAEVCPSFEPADWARAVTGLLADSSKLAAMRERGAARVKDFDWADSARVAADAYREVAG